MTRRGRAQGTCYWCDRDIEFSCEYRTRDHNLTPDFPHVGMFVCGPGCPARPGDTRVYAYVRQDYDGVGR